MISNLPIRVSAPLELAGRTLQIGTLPAGFVTGSVPGTYSTYLDAVSKANELNMFGGIRALATGQTLNSGSSFNVTAGIHRLLFVVNAGIDPNGLLRMSGTAVDRDDGSTGSLAEGITLTGVSTDNSAAGTHLTTLYDFTKCYISDSWRTGTTTISTSGGDTVDLSDLDVYAIAYDQFGDQADITLNAVDMTTKVGSTAGNIEYALYTISKNGSAAQEYDLTNQTNVVQTGATDTWYRLRRGNLAIALDGSDGEGFFMAVQVSSNRAFESMTTVIHWDRDISLP